MRGSPATSSTAAAPTPTLSQGEREQDPALERLERLLDQLTDPEIPVISLREMGILREVRHAAGGQVEVVITPTYSGCPAMDQIADDVAAALRASGVAGRVVTQLAPAWTTDWMTPAAREKLRAYGIAPPRICGAAVAHGGQPIRITRRKRAGSADGTCVEDLPGPDSAIACPQCGSTHTTEISHFGSTACKALYRCLDCLEPFDYFKPI